MSLMQLPIQVKKNINLSIDEITTFCDRWQIVEFALFGSVLRDDFRSDSDIDILITQGENAKISLFDVVNMQEELVIILHRPIDLVFKDGVISSLNYLRKQEILSTAVTVYEQRETVIT